MTLRTLKMVFFGSAVLISVSMFLAFLAAPLLGSVYLGMLKSVGSEFSGLTREFVLPMLRVDPAVFYQRPVNFGWVSACWGVMIVAPLLIMIWSLRSSTIETCLARWSGGIMLYFPVILTLFILLISGMQW